MNRLRQRFATGRSSQPAGVSRRSVFSLLGVIALASVTLCAGSQAQAQDVFVGSLNNDNVVRFNSAGANQGVFASGGISNLIQMAFSPTNGDLYITSFFNNQVRRYNGTTGAFVQSFTANGAAGIVFNAAGEFFVTDYINGLVTRATEAGVSQGTFASGLTTPLFLTTLANGDFLTTDGNNNTITRLNSTTGAASLFTNTSLSAPAGMTLGSDGNLYVANRASNAITRYNGTTGAFIDTFSSGGTLSGPIDLAFVPDGRLLVANLTGNRVVAINSVGAQSIFATGINTPAALVIRSITAATAPEPATFALLTLGIVVTGSGVVARRRYVFARK